MDVILLSGSESDPLNDDTATSYSSCSEEEDLPKSPDSSSASKVSRFSLLEPNLQRDILVVSLLTYEQKDESHGNSK